MGRTSTSGCGHAPSSGSFFTVKPAHDQEARTAGDRPSPLITLAAGEALECLTLPGLRVIIPEMVYFEVTQDLAKTGAQDIVGWSRRHPGQVEVVMTSTFAEFQVLRAADARTRSKGRGEQAALEVLNAAVDDDPKLEAILLFEDSDVRKGGFVRLLPERVTALSNGDLLRELEAAGRIQSSDRVLDVAAAKKRNVEAQRTSAASEADRSPLRDALRRVPGRSG